MQIKSFSELTTPDDRVLRFTSLGFSPSGKLKPEVAAIYQQELIGGCDLAPEVPEGTRSSFERLRTLHSYGILFYEAFTIAQDLAWLLLEQALSERFMKFHNGVVPLVDVETGEERPITSDQFNDVSQAFLSRGSHKKGRWHLRLSSGATIPFRGRLSQLQDWARSEHLLEGQRNRCLDPLHIEMRNASAHPRYHLSMPPSSARTIQDLAEIINRLYGHATPGGRLYPTPLDREVLVLVWNELGNSVTLLRDYQLGTFTDPGDWTCIIIRATFEDDEVWNFDAQYERTSYPAELLWGPGSAEDALRWINQEQPAGDSVPHLDRLFAIRIFDGQVSLARRPEVALALPLDKRVGRWFLVRADFPNDAFVHLRHVKDGHACASSKSVTNLVMPEPAVTGKWSGCAVEELFDGTWEGMAQELYSGFNITESAILSTVRVRTGFTTNVASDVEAD